MTDFDTNYHVPMNEQRTKVFLDRYALRNTAGETIESSPSQSWLRVADAIADNEDQRTRFRELLWDFKFVPGGRIMSGAGTGTEVTFYNCYVIPIETRERRENRKNAEFPAQEFEKDAGSDSREAILDTLSVMVDIMSRGGGVGINWSVLRPKGAHLSRVNGTTSGPVAWMDVASHAVQTVTQGGSRRGAAMWMLDDWHPDLLEFIDAKRDHTKITGANVSVAVSDDFMAAVKEERDWVLQFPDTGDPRYNSEWDGDLSRWKAGGGRVVDYATIPARTIWRAITQAAWDNGEPGVVFLSRYNSRSTGRDVERIICVNPCGEQGLGAYSVCNLGSMNLDAYIVKDDSYTAKYRGKKYRFDWDAFIRDSEDATEFLDNVIDKNYYFLPENELIQKRLRRIGLGVMGLADAMIALGIRYGSPESVEFTERVFSTLKVAAIRRSSLLARDKGAAPDWDRSMMARPYLAELGDSPLSRQVFMHGLRNLFLLTQAPTGSTSLLAGVNSGIEPHFAFEYTRVDRTGTHTVVPGAVEKYRDFAVSAGPEWVTSNDVKVREHIAVQAAVQKFVDSSVSKTINGPNSHTVEDVEQAYMLAYDSGLKGVAYFRDGNGREQVLYNKEEPKDVEFVSDRDDDALAFDHGDLGDEMGYVAELHELVPFAIDYRRPDVLTGSTSKVATRAGTAYVTVNRDSDTGQPVEVFFNVGKAGSEVAALAEALGRLASLSLRKGATLGGVANQLEGVGGAGNFNKSIAHAISEALSAENTRYTDFPEDDPPYESDFSKPEPTTTEAEPDRGVTVVKRAQPGVTGQGPDLCPECHNFSLLRQEGCSKCAICGYSAC